MNTYTFTFHVVHANTEGMTTSQKWFRRTLTWEIEAENEEGARTRLGQRIEAEYPRRANYKAINVEFIPNRW